MNAHTNLPSGSSYWKERHPRRLPMACDIKLRTADGEVIEVRLVDFSRRGFGLESDRIVLIGSTVALDLPGLGWVDGEVRWNIGNRIGGWFVEEIAPGATQELPCDEEDQG